VATKTDVAQALTGELGWFLSQMMRLQVLEVSQEKKPATFGATPRYPEKTG
jgi:hypothetical protein